LNEQIAEVADEKANTLSHVKAALKSAITAVLLRRTITEEPSLEY
jgi:hypothetical protein